MADEYSRGVADGLCKDIRETKICDSESVEDIPQRDSQTPHSDVKADKKKKLDIAKRNSEVKLAALAKDSREVVNIVLIGHVDAGKSTIGGHLLLLTGVVDKRTMEKYEREAKEKNRETWYLSWALDTNIEERDKGKTVEVGKACIETPNKRIVILDAPGHKGFVPNMIGGAVQADVAVLVISARKGEFETGFERGGQTREHALIAKIAGSKFLIVAVNKMDDTTVCWEQQRYKEIESKLTPYLKRIGFRPCDIFYMPCSGFTGANLRDPLTSDVCSWFKGPSLLQLIDQLPSFNNDGDKPPRVLISDRYKDMGTIVMGKVVAGFVGKGDSFVLLPVNKNTRVSSIFSIDDTELNVARTGENVKMRLVNVEDEDVPLGSILCSPEKLCHTGSYFDAQLLILDCKNIIAPGHSFILHIHNAVDNATLLKIHYKIDRKTGQQTDVKQRFVKQDDACVARFKTVGSLCMSTFHECADLGRFTLRDEGRTVAVGKIMKILRPKMTQ